MQTTIHIPDELWRVAKTECVHRKCSLSELVRNALALDLYGVPVVDTVSDIPVKSRGKGKAELPKMLPRK